MMFHIYSYILLEKEKLEQNYIYCKVEHEEEVQKQQNEKIYISAKLNWT